MAPKRKTSRKKSKASKGAKPINGKNGDGMIAANKASSSNDEENSAQQHGITEGNMSQSIQYLERQNRLQLESVSDVSTDSDDEIDDDVFDEIPIFTHCRCRPEPVPQSVATFQAAVKKYIDSVTNGDRLKRATRCSRLPHPRIFYDAGFGLDRERFPLVDLFVTQGILDCSQKFQADFNPNVCFLDSFDLEKVQEFAKNADPGNSCTCEGGLAKMCLDCKYFLFIVTATSHRIFGCFFNLMKTLEEYANCLERSNNEKFFSGFIWNCVGCEIPMNGHENTGEYSEFSKCNLRDDLAYVRRKVQTMKIYFMTMDSNMSKGKLLKNTEQYLIICVFFQICAGH